MPLASPNDEHTVFKLFLEIYWPLKPFKSLVLLRFFIFLKEVSYAQQAAFIFENIIIYLCNFITISNNYFYDNIF